jgi:hypothetical protein
VKATRREETAREDVAPSRPRRAPAALATARAAQAPASGAALAAPETPAPAAASVAPARATATPAPSALRAEAELIERALAALHEGDQARADAWLAAHAARFPDGALRRERERARRRLTRLSDSTGDRSNEEKAR